MQTIYVDEDLRTRVKSTVEVLLEGCTGYSEKVTTLDTVEEMLNTLNINDNDLLIFLGDVREAL